MHDPTLNRRVLTIPAAARRIGRSERTIQRWISEGRLESVGGLVYERQLLHAVRAAEQARNTPRGVSAAKKAPGQPPNGNLAITMGDLHATERHQLCVWGQCDNRVCSRHEDVPLCRPHMVLCWQLIQEEHESWTRRQVPVQARTAQLEPEAAAGTIYYLQIGEHIKIGHARNLWNRLRGYPPTAKLLACHPGTRADEAALHRRLRGYRVAGREWYEPNPHILELIAQVIVDHGEPPKALTGARRPETLKPRPGKWVL